MRPPSETLRHFRGLPLMGAPNRRICGSLTLAQISQGETSHIPGTVYAIVSKRLKVKKHILEVRLYYTNYNEKEA